MLSSQMPVEDIIMEGSLLLNKDSRKQIKLAAACSNSSILRVAICVVSFLERIIDMLTCPVGTKYR
jgi:hypothetical protein